MKITIQTELQEISINDYKNEVDITCQDAIELFERVLAGMGFHHDTIAAAFGDDPIEEKIY